MKEGNTKDRKKILIIILVSIIIVLLIILGYGVYSGFKVKAMIISLNNQIAQLNEERDTLNADKADLTSKLNTLQGKYDLLYEDVQKIYRGCYREDACKGRLPGVSWYCNNVGDEAIDNPSHICVCDASCNLNATEIKR